VYNGSNLDGEDMAKFLDEYVMWTTEASKHALEIAQKHSSKEKQNEALNETGLRAITNAF
jgi:ribosomal silencing factor RsfS